MMTETEKMIWMVTIWLAASVAVIITLQFV
jgi:hypothetical protein